LLQLSQHSLVLILIFYILYLKIFQHQDQHQILLLSQHNQIILMLPLLQ